jgi:hypothetical protein
MSTHDGPTDGKAQADPDNGSFAIPALKLVEQPGRFSRR